MNAEDDDFGRSFLDFAPAPVRSASATSSDTAHADDADDAADQARAYLLTGGRTGGGKAGVKLETMVVSGRVARLARYLSPEQKSIVETVRSQAMAVAEVAARTGLVLGVAQVLIGDLVHDGILNSSQPVVSLHDDIDLLERMIASVAAL